MLCKKVLSLVLFGRLRVLYKNQCIYINPHQFEFFQLALLSFVKTSFFAKILGYTFVSQNQNYYGEFLNIISYKYSCPKQSICTKFNQISKHSLEFIKDITTSQTFYTTLTTVTAHSSPLISSVHQSYLYNQTDVECAQQIFNRRP